MYDICDMHSHILPGIDDGCRTPQESVAVLKKMRNDGVTKIFATPHFYHSRGPVEEFLACRQASEEVLRAALAEESQPVPAICCGAEVAYFSGIADFEELSQLCLGKSRFLLLELPFAPWSGQIVRDVGNLCLQGFVPILAHFERYGGVQDRTMVRKILEFEPLVQMNAGRLLDVWKGRGARSALKRDAVHLLGSDCHGLERRPPQLGQAIALLEKKKMHTELARIEALSNEIFREACGGEDENCRQRID